MIIFNLKTFFSGYRACFFFLLSGFRLYFPASGSTYTPNEQHFYTYTDLRVNVKLNFFWKITINFAVKYEQPAFSHQWPVPGCGLWPCHIWPRLVLENLEEAQNMYTTSWNFHAHVCNNVCTYLVVWNLNKHITKFGKK